MNTIKITAKDLDSNNYYKEDGIGHIGPDFEGNVEIAENLGTVRFRKGVYVTGYILAGAGSGIKAGSGITAGNGITAGWGITAGDGIEAGWGITAGNGIECKGELSFNYKLFAGTSPWTDSADKYVRCGKLVKGTIAYGDLEETGMEDDKVEIKVEGKTIMISRESAKALNLID